MNKLIGNDCQLSQPASNSAGPETTEQFTELAEVLDDMSNERSNSTYRSLRKSFHRHRNSAARNASLHLFLVDHASL